VTVNVSVAEVERDDFIPVVRDALAQAGLSPARLWLEITERGAGQDGQKLRSRLLELEALGVRAALDDFGTGWSSLSHLHDLPVKMIKIDQEFVIGETGTAAHALAASVALVGQALSMAVVAEGIETTEQLQRVRQMACPFGQGFLLGRPVNAHDFHAQHAVPVPVPRAGQSAAGGAMAGQL
jgi:EAL domain-containing protein (putative c-di-GMP-specific phosphodiesterase class I)